MMSESTATSVCPGYPRPGDKPCPAPGVGNGCECRYQQFPRAGFQSDDWCYCACHRPCGQCPPPEKVDKGRAGRKEVRGIDLLRAMLPEPCDHRDTLPHSQWDSEGHCMVRAREWEVCLRCGADVPYGWSAEQMARAERMAAEQGSFRPSGPTFLVSNAEYEAIRSNPDHWLHGLIPALPSPDELVDEYIDHWCPDRWWSIGNGLYGMREQGRAALKEYVRTGEKPPTAYSSGQLEYLFGKFDWWRTESGLAERIAERKRQDALGREAPMT